MDEIITQNEPGRPREYADPVYMRGRMERWKRDEIRLLFDGVDDTRIVDKLVTAELERRATLCAAHESEESNA